VRVGLCYDLRDRYLAAGYGEEETAEFDSAATIDAIESALRELGHETERIGHVGELAARLAAGRRWDLVFNTAEGLRGVGREAQVPALLEAFDVAYTFADPLVAALTLHKAMAKRVLRDLGLPTAAFRVVETPADAKRVDLPFPLFVKPLAEGTAKGIDAGSRVATREALEERCAQLIARHRQPALVEPYLPGREFTVGLTGTSAEAVAVGTLEIALRPGSEPHSYTYLNKEQCEELCDYRPAEPAAAAPLEAMALAAWRGIGGRDAGRVDFRLGADGLPYVLEINPLPGLHPTHSDLPMICTASGIPYLELIDHIVGSAARRIGAEPPRRLP
jgi:D-alanine-D-alanine ligase